ncbi:MAG: MarR family winged helix-turn-helix transcriptional regulator [Thermoleophilia bacterium]
MNSAPPHSLDRTEVRETARIYIKLVRAAEAVSGRVHEHLAESGLTFSQFAVMEALFSLGSMCQRDLARKILKSSGNMTMVIDNLEKKGFVHRERSTSDRRFMNVHLTESGRAFIQSRYPRHVANIVREMEVLTPEERMELGRLCRKVGLGGREDSTGPA